MTAFRTRPTVSKRAQDFATHGTNFVEPPSDIPMTLRPGVGPKLLALPQFRQMSIADCIEKAKKLTKNRIPVSDKAVAIALILGAEGALQ